MFQLKYNSEYYLQQHTKNNMLAVRVKTGLTEEVLSILMGLLNSFIIMDVHFMKHVHILLMWTGFMAELQIVW